LLKKTRFQFFDKEQVPLDSPASPSANAMSPEIGAPESQSTTPSLSKLVINTASSGRGKLVLGGNVLFRRQSNKNMLKYSFKTTFVSICK
jgi:hypothetical protein